MVKCRAFATDAVVAQGLLIRRLIGLNIYTALSIVSKTVNGFS